MRESLFSSGARYGAMGRDMRQRIRLAPLEGSRQSKDSYPVHVERCGWRTPAASALEVSDRKSPVRGGRSVPEQGRRLDAVAVLPDGRCTARQRDKQHEEPSMAYSEDVQELM